eukprot:531795-Prorocentrum_minimum.AAC.4
MSAGQEAAKLDRQASTEAVWGTAGGGGGLRLEQVLRARCLELKMHPGRTREVTTGRLRQAETCSPGVPRIASWGGGGVTFEILGGLDRPEPKPRKTTPPGREAHPYPK